MSFIPKYMLGVSAGYHFEIGNIGKNLYDPEGLRYKSKFRDVIVTRPKIKTDLERIDDNALMTINGYIHPTIWNNNQLYIKEGVPSLLHSKRNNVGIISFDDIDITLDKHFITEEMLFKDGEYSLFERVNIKLEKPVDGIFFVFAGYLITEQDRYLERIADDEFIFYPERINFIDKMYELSVYTDIFKELEIEVAPHDETMVRYEELTSDASIKKLMTRFNTFIVNIPKHTIAYDTIDLDHTSIPGTYTTANNCQYPLIGGFGKLIEYKSTCYDYDVFREVITTTDMHYNNLVSRHKFPATLDIISGQRRVGDTYRLTPAAFLKMKIDKM